jgi:hypothetical protein
MPSLPGSGAFVSVYIDPQLTRVDPAQSEHARLTISNTHVRTFSTGDGQGGYTLNLPIDDQWGADYTTTGTVTQVRSAEFRISSTLLGGMQHQIGLALEQDPTGRGDLLGWPALSSNVQPSSWSRATLAAADPPFTFSGTVVHQPTNAALAPTGVGGVTATLVGSDLVGNDTIVASTTTSLAGTFNLSTTTTFAKFRIELGSPPQGILYQSTISPNGTIVDEDTIDFGAAAAFIYTNNQFILSNLHPSILDSNSGPVYLIIAKKAVIDSQALDDFIAFNKTPGGYHRDQRIGNHRRRHRGLALHPARHDRREYAHLPGCQSDAFNQRILPHDRAEPDG